MDNHKQDIVKWKNGVGERIEQKLADTYQKIGCIAVVECYSVMLDFDATYEGDVVQIDDLPDGSFVVGTSTMSLGLLQRRRDTAIHVVALASSEAQVQPPICRVVAVRKLICVPDMTSLITYACTVEAVVDKLRQIDHSQLYNSSKKFHYFCGLEDTVLETNDYYRRRFVVYLREFTLEKRKLTFDSCARSCSHDAWFKRTRSKENKVIVISKLQSSVNKMKATLLETRVKMRSYKDSNVKLIHDLCSAKGSTKIGCARPQYRC
ncbi:hypothetical protein Cgig2_012535 [Carnegiea gigantea]|uniref:Uncharacterized protein n=1 Tax=Carnegiea gigantea TaxID=171969 RepID=A0A9Q1JEN1_9CARY|nr:hypothetical protein Cgig2_012535 [Carnegiea gigantea]